MKVRLTREAQGDLTAILSFIHERSPSGARNVLAAFDRALEVLARHPEVGQLTDRPPVRLKLVSGFPYKIFYRVKGDEIEVFHIRHAARRPWEGQ